MSKTFTLERAFYLVQPITTCIELRMRTLITDEARLAIYDGHDGIELIDLNNDPSVMNNLQHTGPMLRSAMMEHMNYSLMAAEDTSPEPTAFA